MSTSPPERPGPVGGAAPEASPALPPTVLHASAVPADSVTLPPSGPSERVPPSPRPPDADSATLPPSAPAAGDPAVKPGAVPGYEVLGELGRGGMGVVYKARQVALNRTVALKMVLAGSHAGPAERQRFKAEAESVARLQHPNIVQVYEVGESEGRPFFSLEYVDGGSLADKLAGTPLPPPQAAELVRTLARAVQAAHDKGVVHRDLKPANVLLAACGSAEGAKPQAAFVPKVTDFGLAKHLDSAAQQTQPGAIVGTPSYMAPEQAGGPAREVGPLADVYALGAILYECLTGRPPFLAATTMDTVLQVIADEPVPPRRLQPKVPHDLETICLKCLHKETRRRYASASALADDLHCFLRDEPILARPVGAAERLWRWCRRNPRTALLTAAVLLLLVTVAAGSTVAALLVNRSRHDEREARLASDQARDREAQQRRQAQGLADENRRQLVRSHVANGVRLLHEGDLSGSLLWFHQALDLDDGDPSAHRTRLASVWRQCPKFTHLWSQREAVMQVALSADGRRAVTASNDRTARVWDLQTGEPVGPVLRHDGPLFSAGFSPDGKRVVTGGGALGVNGEVRLWEAGTDRELLPAIRLGNAAVYAGFLGDGRRFVTLEVTIKGTSIARAWEAATGKALESVALEANGPSPWEHLPFLSLASGRVLQVGGTQARVFDVVTGRPVSGPLRCGDRIHFARISPDGERVVTAARDGKLTVWDASTGKEVTAPLDHFRQISGASFGQPGRLTVAYRDGVVQTVDIVSGKPTSAPNPVGTAGWQVVFSPDGRFVGGLGHDGSARVWPVDARAAVTPVLRHTASITFAAFSPDGRLFLTACADGTTRAWDLATVGLPRLALWQGFLPSEVRFTPDGTRVVAVGPNGVAAWDPRSGRAVAGPAGNKEILSAWLSEDGRRVVTGSRQGVAQLWEVGKKGPVSRPLGHPGTLVRDVRLSPDGRYVATLAVGSLDMAGVYRGEARVWDVASGKMTTDKPLTFAGVVSGVVCTAFSPDGRLVALGGGQIDVDGSIRSLVRLHESHNGTRSGPELALSPGMIPVVIDFSPDGGRVAAMGRFLTGGGGEVRVWDVSSGRPVFAPLPLVAGGRQAVFDPSGRLLAATDLDLVRVWRTGSGRPAYPPLKHTGEVYRARFSRDGRYLVTTSLDDTVRVWDARTGDPVTPPLWHPNRIGAVDLSPDGRALAAGCGDNILRIWDLGADDRPADDLARMARLLGGREAGAADGEVLAESWKVLRGKYPGDFRPTTGQLVDWHDRQATACERARLWPSVLVHAERLVEAAPDRPQHWGRRANARAYLGQFAAAVDDFAQAARRAPDNNWYWYCGAASRLAAGDRDGHRQHCAEMLRRFGGATDAFVAERVAKACLVVPGGVADPAPAVKLAERATAGPRSPDYFWFCLARGIAEHRVGRPAGAAEWLEKARGLPNRPTAGDALAQAFLAMARHQLGQPEKARSLLEAAEAFARSADAVAVGWIDLAFLRAALPEVRDVLRSPPKQQKGGER